MSGNTLNGPVQDRNFAVIIPCFNEEGTIGDLVRGVLRVAPSVYVINDQSLDSTAAEAGKAGATVIENIYKKGKGSALRYGFHKAGKAGFEWGLAMDGDGQHDPADIPKFFTNAADLVIGNRMDDPVAMSKTRRIVNRWMSRRISKLAEVEIADSQCGMRLARLDPVEKMRFEEDGFAFESELIVRFAREGLKIESVPIRCLATQRPSRIFAARDTFRWLRWFLRANLRG
jgi:glycosyltransferase involved in cell wall biosynthesis